jgi:hypothetical protein
MSARLQRGMTAIARIVLSAALLGPLGCSGRRVPVPAISSEQASQQALALYDRNSDGILDAAELSRCPALANGLKIMDTNKDGRLSGSEIAERINDYQTSRVGLAAMNVKVTMNGKPLVGATVTLTPEKFLGDSVQPASGITDARGQARLETSGANAPGVSFGLFRVEISKKDAGGRETLDARYNRTTNLGLEVGPGTRKGTVRFALSRSSLPASGERQRPEFR